jgi:signal transduction histidine kinase
VSASFTITRLLTLGALLGLMVLAALGFRAQEKDMEGLRDASKETIFWSASQAEAELARFLASLGQYSIGDPAVTEADVVRRFDILWSRMLLFHQGDVGRRLSSHDHVSLVIDEIDRLMKKFEPDILNLRREGQTDRHREILSEFTGAGDRLRAMSVRVLGEEQTRYAGVRQKVRSSAQLTWVVSMAALVLALILICVMLVETRRYRRMAEESAELAERAEAASSAKSKFLTMMSHELRTPMNGVLGLLALVRQTALNERQARLVEQAERSGRQMSALLGDILDFSDLQSDKLVLGRELFEISALAGEVEQMFGPIIPREGVSFRIDIDPSAPRWVAGDMGRLRQSLGHFVTFLVDMVGTRDVRLAVSGADAAVLFEIDVATRPDAGPGWQPEAIFGRASAQYAEFASDSLGPMIARDLVELMGGSVSMQRPAPGRAVLAIWMPLEAAEGPGGSVRVDAQSGTVQTVLVALLRQLGHRIWCQEADSKSVSVVLMEAGGSDEAALAERLRSAHPRAHLIAIGGPARRDLFDGVCPQPVDAKSLEAALAVAERLQLRVC